MPTNKKKKTKNRSAQEDNINDAEPTLSKREQRRQKKLQTHQEQQIEADEEQKAEYLSECDEKEAIDEIDLFAIKEAQQEALLKIGNDLMVNLDDKYFPFFTADFEDIWQQQMIQIAFFYEQENISNNLESLLSEQLFNEKKNELESIWNKEILSLLQEDLEASQQNNTIETVQTKLSKPQTPFQRQEIDSNFEEKYFENDESDENPLMCPICCTDDCAMLCELDCYVFRNDNVKHCICAECVRRLFKSNRWYHRAKCPFCRHTIHRDVILNGVYESPELEDNNNDENVQRGNIRGEFPDPRLYWDSYRQYVQQSQHVNFSEQLIGDSWESLTWKDLLSFLCVIAFICFHYKYMLFGVISLIISIVVFVINNESSLVNDLGQLGEEMRILYHEQTVPRRPRRMLHIVTNRNRCSRKKKDSNVYRKKTKRLNKYRNKVRNKQMKITRQTQKYNKRFRNRNFR